MEDLEVAVHNIQEYVKQQEKNGIRFETAFDIADQLGVPVSVVNRALQGLNQNEEIQYPYDSSEVF
jgi:CO dehydrogenase/acetyl-CoA synthase epsilon subunit